MALNICKIGMDLDSFLNEHPEIKLNRIGNEIISIQIPDDAIISFLYIKDSELLHLEYIYNDNLIKYSI